MRRSFSLFLVIIVVFLLPSPQLNFTSLLRGSYQTRIRVHIYSYIGYVASLAYRKLYIIIRYFFAVGIRCISIHIYIKTSSPFFYRVFFASSTQARRFIIMKKLLHYISYYISHSCIRASINFIMFIYTIDIMCRTYINYCIKN